MQTDYRNICKIARDTTGRTQERFAEMVGVSVEAVRQYEAGTIMPGDDVVTAMIEVSGMPVLGYWHLLNKSRVAGELLPEVERMPLSQAVCQLLHRMRDFADKHRGDDLLWISANGKVDPGEQERVFGEISGELDLIVQAALQLKFAKNAEN